MFGHGWRLGRIAGVEIRIDPSWAVIALLVAYSLFLHFTLTYRSLSDPAGLALAVGATVVFFGSVLAHELTHAVVARRLGIPVHGITLFIFGGATHAEVDSKGPRDELLVSAVGPVSSLVIAAVLWGVSVLGRGVVAHPLEGAVGYLAWVNAILAVFNLLPGFPLDGGRILRAAVWATTGSLARATRVAAAAGQTVGYLLLAVGALLVFGGALISGVWLAAIGWFLAQTAKASLRDFTVRQMLGRVEADQVMERELAAVPATATLREAVDDYLLQRDQDVFPVEEGGRTIGFLTVEVVRRFPRGGWEGRTVRDAMLAIDRNGVVGPHSRMEDVLDRLELGGVGFVPVMSQDRIVGVVTPADLARWMRRHESIAA